jgi:7,8-dihydroneopterin aldolase/epimerase/oxygenase
LIKTKAYFRDDMMFIHLHNLNFYSFHGVHEEERILGADYELNISAGFGPSTDIIRELDETLDYTAVYDLVKQRMAVPTPLLETIAMEISAAIQSKYPSVDKIFISIKKLYPPINNFEGSVGVSFEWNK